MKNIRTFTSVIAAVIIAFLSIYAVNPTTIVSNNHTSGTVSVVLQLQSGGQISVTDAPSSSVTTTVGSDVVVGLTYNGIYVPAGQNIIVPNLNGGSIQFVWTMDPQTNCAGGWDTMEAS